LARQSGQPLSEIRNRLADARQRLLDARAQRSLPLDDKLLAGWNGLLLNALASASAQLQNRQFHMAARQLRDYLLKELWDGRQLFRAVHKGQPMGQASLADYAYVALGLKSWARISNSTEDAKTADQLLQAAWSRFHTDKGWLSGSGALLPGMPSVQAQEDGALPAAAALIVQLSLNSSDKQLRRKAQAVMPDTQRAIQNNPFWYATHVNGLLGSETDKQDAPLIFDGTQSGAVHQ